MCGIGLRNLEADAGSNIQKQCCITTPCLLCIVVVPVGCKNSSEVGSGSKLLSGLSLGRSGVKWFRTLTAIMAAINDGSLLRFE